MKRRDFIRNISLSSLSVPLFLNGMSWEAIPQSLFHVADGVSDRVLVLIRLNGGNDGLNTFIPLDYYDQLNFQRPHVILPEQSIIKVSDKNGFHSATKEMSEMFLEEKLSVIQNVGYPDQNRSHFRSMDIWSSGMMDPTKTTGWLGRNLDSDYKNFPKEYPNEEFKDPFAISMGYNISGTCQGEVGNFSYTVNDPNDNFNLEMKKIKSRQSYHGNNLDYLTTTIRQTNSYGERIKDAANQGSSNKELYNSKNPLAMHLSNVAKMISGGLGTSIYILNIDGFDTHGEQVEMDDNSKGAHADLLQMLSEGISSFQNDLQQLKIDQRVIGMTFSEFGRQVASNSNRGTDHGDAGPIFMFGSKIKPGIMGENPEIKKEVEDQAGLPFVYDFRDIYASVLKDWFNVSESKVESLFEHEVKFYPLLA